MRKHFRLFHFISLLLSPRCFRCFRCSHLVSKYIGIIVEMFLENGDSHKSKNYGLLNRVSFIWKIAQIFQWKCKHKQTHENRKRENEVWSTNDTQKNCFQKIAFSSRVRTWERKYEFVFQMDKFSCRFFWRNKCNEIWRMCSHSWLLCAK